MPSNCPVCLKPIVDGKYVVEGAAVVVYLTKNCHLACAIQHIFKMNKGPPPENKLGVA